MVSTEMKYTQIIIYRLLPRQCHICHCEGAKRPKQSPNSEMRLLRRLWRLAMTGKVAQCGSLLKCDIVELLSLWLQSFAECFTEIHRGKSGFLSVLCDSLCPNRDCLSSNIYRIQSGCLFTFPHISNNRLTTPTASFAFSA